MSTKKAQVSLEELPRDELLKKYKNVLVIAQRAKQARDDAVNQLNNVKSEKSELFLKQDHLLKENYELMIKELKNINESLEDELAGYRGKTITDDQQNSTKFTASLQDHIISQLHGIKRENSKIKVEIANCFEVWNSSIFPSFSKNLINITNADFLRALLEVEEWRSETHSTSTLSQIEESNRLKDVEGSFEECNQKLKLYALKQKKKIAMLTSELEMLEQDRASMTREKETFKKKAENLQKENDKLACHARNFQNLQVEYDKIQDNLEIETKNRKEVESRLQEMGTLRAEVANLKEKLDNLQSSYIQAEKDKSSLLDENTLCKQNNSQLQTSLSAEIKKSQCLTATINALEADISCRKDLENDYKQKQDQLLHEKDLSHMNVMKEKTQEIEMFRKMEIELQAKVLQYQSQIELLNQKSEELNINLSHEVVAKEKLMESLVQCETNSKRQIALLGSKLQDVTGQLELSHSDLDNVRGEFENYKVRVHCVLKQQQNDCQDDQVTRDKEEHEKQLARLNEVIKNLKEQLEVREAELGESKHLASSSEAAKELAEKKFVDKELNILAQLQTKNESLKQVTESLKKSQLENKLLTSSYKNQIDAINQDHIEKVIKLERHISELQQEIARIPQSITDDVRPAVEALLVEEKEAVVLMDMPRGQGEGSECTSDAPISPPLSLEKLLVGDSELDDWTRSEKLVELEAKCIESEKKLQHMTYLLNESEASNSRLSELTDALKEEIRRHQRNLEREKHLENMEYLKNVVYKFITLTSCDEKRRLVPVLSTMLRLSPEEKRDLASIADGVVSGKAISKEGWSSYFQMWSNKNN